MSAHAMPGRDQYAELCRLIQSLYDECITPAEREQLEEWLCRDKEARRIYSQYMNLFATLYWEKSRFPDLEETPPKTESRPPRSPVLGFLGDCFQQGASFLYRSNVFTLLVAIGLPGLVLAVFVTALVRQSPQPTVATIMRTRDCVGHVNDQNIVSSLSPGMGLAQGHRVTLREGFVEIGFADGARTILEGPTTLEIRDRRSGFLREGHLTASVPPQAVGFTIETPLMKVVDHGTEFGVWVERDQKAAEVHVFSGEVELDARGDDRPGSSSWRLTTGFAARVETFGPRRDVVVRECSPSEIRFVRSLTEANATDVPAAPPRAAESGTSEILADFSGGNGDMFADQYPGTAGAGWTGAWGVRSLPELSCDASVEEGHPLLGGGKYLHVVMRRDPFSTDARAWAGINRRMEANNGVDLSRRYVITFNFRIDVLSPSWVKGDRMSICGRSRSQDEHAVDEQGGSIGWHIYVADRDGMGDDAKEWVFHRRSDAGSGALVPSGIAVREGAVYSFRIAVDPDAGQWTPSIAVDGGPPTAFEPMHMRSVGTAKQNQYWPFLHFYWLTHARDKANTTDKLGFALDSIEVTAE